MYMPTSLFIETTRRCRALVDAVDFPGLEIYFNTPLTWADTTECEDEDDFASIDPNRCDMPLAMKATLHVHEIDKALQMYHIMSYAIDTANIPVVNHFLKQTNLDYVPHGNAYTLAGLAIENYLNERDQDDLMTKKASVKQPINQETTKAVMMLLVNEKLDLDYDSRKLVCNNPDYELIDMLVTKNVNLWAMYHYSIAWGHPDIYRFLVQNYPDKINATWLQGALEIADRFGHGTIMRKVLD